MADPPGVTISGVGAYRPETVVSNLEISQRAGVAEDWISSRSGVQERRHATGEESLAVMAAEAGRAALADAGARPEDVDLVIVATATHARPMPAVAPQAAHALGCERAGTYDLNAACAGFTYALSTATSLLQSGAARTALVIGAERLTDWTSPAVTDTFAIMADGAGAVMLTRSERHGVRAAVWGNEGGRADYIVMPDDADAPEVRMRGPLVYKWAVDTLPGVARRACEVAGVALRDIDWLVPHQANARILDTLAAALGIPTGKVVRDVVKSGNTSSASIPLALSTLRERGHARNGEHLLLLGFGSGLSYCGLVVQMH
ncbi:beta-ketoacyl-ACP synthase 3 [Streptomyces sp. SM11]|uniref:beta-ketoacyl-ACP synthase 3 n=1 Tax=Streptomyces sp. SM11 TaxID=565557 RepID=UPI000CD4E592|nr:beta-ketoacyl-ACP synthase 3 [Streptomyces sp. SM11]